MSDALVDAPSAQPEIDASPAMLFNDGRGWPDQVFEARLPDGRRVTARILPRRRTENSSPPVPHTKGGWRAHCTTRFEGQPKAKTLTCRVYPETDESGAITDWAIEFERRPRNNVKMEDR